jgi:hypothetical protein
MRFAFALVLLASALPIAGTAGADPVIDALTPGPLLSEALERERSGVDVPWSNAATGQKGVIRVERTFYRGQQPCRDYVWTREASGGAKAEVRGTGCRVAKAKWQTEEKPVPPPTPLAAPALPPLTLGSGTSPTAAPAPPPSGGSAAPAKAAEAPRPVRKPPSLTFTVPPRSDL